MAVKPVATFKFKFGDGRLGMTWNPMNQRNTIKIIFHDKYTNKVKKVEVWTKEGEFYEALKRAIPNEKPNRQRYYGKKKPKVYPKNITVFGYMKDGSIGSCVIKDPAKRYD